jgi:hypothetical protein
MTFMLQKTQATVKMFVLLQIDKETERQRQRKTEKQIDLYAAKYTGNC